MSRKVGEPLLDDANFVLATLPMKVATLPWREAAFDQLIASRHVAALKLSGWADAGATAIAAAITPATNKDLFMPLPFVDGVTATLRHQRVEVNQPLDFETKEHTGATWFRRGRSIRMSCKPRSPVGLVNPPANNKCESS